MAESMFKGEKEGVIQRKAIKMGGRFPRRNGGWKDGGSNVDCSRRNEIDC